MKTLNLTYGTESLEKAQAFIQNTLEAYGTDRKTVLRTLLSTEELLARMTDGPLSVSVRNLFGELEVQLRGCGAPFDIADIADASVEHEDPEVQSVIRSLMQKLLGGTVAVTCSRGRIHATVSVKKSPQKQLFKTLAGLALGTLAGIFVRLCLPPSVQSVLCADVFDVVSTVFLNAIKIVVTPLVFFSIAASLAGVSDMKALGRIGVKVAFFSIMASFLAIGAGLVTDYIFPTGDPALQAGVTVTAASSSIVNESGSVSLSLADTVKKIVPSDIISPLLNADMLQVIFLAILMGAAASKAGEYAPACRKGLEALNAIFNRATAMIISIMPAAIFCSMAKMVININAECVLSLLSWPLAVCLGFLIQFILYALLILVAGKLNPLTFFRKFSSPILTALSLCSSNATLPLSMETCGKKLGIDQKIYSFSIPLGQTINMHGNIISLMVSAFFMTKTYGIVPSPHTIVQLCISVFILCTGSPGIPGGSLVALAVLLPQLGVPVEAISLIMGLYPIAGMLMAGINVAGNAVVTTITAKSEHLLDKSVYNS